MEPGLCLDSGEFIPASELNKQIGVCDPPSPGIQQRLDAQARNYMRVLEQCRALATRNIELESKVVALSEMLTNSLEKTP
jgi:hypothetical protein